MTASFPPLQSKCYAMAYHSDPLALYHTLCADAPHTVLLESAEISTKDHLQSLIMTDAALMIRADDYQLSFTALSHHGAALLPAITHYFSAAPFLAQCHTACPTPINHANQTHPQTNNSALARLTVTLSRPQGIMDEDARLQGISPLDGLRMLMQALPCTALDDNAAAPAFLAGVLAYDLIASAEQLPQVKHGVNHCPDYLFYLAQNVIKIDHQRRSATSSANSVTQHLRRSKNNSSAVRHYCNRPPANYALWPPLRSMPMSASILVISNTVTKLAR